MNLQNRETLLNEDELFTTTQKLRLYFKNGTITARSLESDRF